MPPTDLYVESAGIGEPAVVLVHAGIADRHQWDREFTRFATTNRVVRYDVRGFGASPDPVRNYYDHDDLLGVMDDAGIERAVLVGSALSPSTPKIREGGIEVRTLWGELAWQLGGRAAYDSIGEADRTATNPGAALTEIIAAYAPCVILIDEWVAYARELFRGDLPGGRPRPTSGTPRPARRCRVTHPRPWRPATPLPARCRAHPRWARPRAPRAPRGGGAARRGGGRRRPCRRPR